MKHSPKMFQHLINIILLVWKAVVTISTTLSYTVTAKNNILSLSAHSLIDWAMHNWQKILQRVNYIMYFLIWLVLVISVCSAIISRSLRTHWQMYSAEERSFIFLELSPPRSHTQEWARSLSTKLILVQVVICYRKMTMGWIIQFVIFLKC